MVYTPQSSGIRSKTLLIGELCRRSGLTKDTIRHYESMGLLNTSTRRAGSRFYRLYDEQSLERLELIRIGSRSGFSLREMKPILDPLMAGDLSYEEQRQVVRNQLLRIDDRIGELKTAKQLLRKQIKRINQREHQNS